MDRVADPGMLLADQRPDAALRQAGRHEQAAGAPAHDEHVYGFMH